MLLVLAAAGNFGPRNTIYLKADWSANDTMCSTSYTSIAPLVSLKSGVTLEIE